MPAALATRMTPAPGLEHRRATDREQAEWSDRAAAANTCCWCKVAYRTGSGAAWVCEHWHEGL